MAAFLPAALQIGASLFANKLGGGSKDKIKKVSNFSKGQSRFFSDYLRQMGQLQQGGYNQALGQLQGNLSGDSEAYDRFAAPYMRQFNEQTLPQLAERFAGGAQGGALSSSGFGQALGAAGAGLQENLASLKAQLQQNAIQSILGQYNQGANTALSAQPFSYVSRQGTQGAGQSALSNYLQSATPGSWQGLSNSLVDAFKGFGNTKNLASNPLYNELAMGFKSGAIPFQ